MANGTTDLSLTEKKNPPLNDDVHYNEEFEIDTLSESPPKSIAKDADTTEDGINSAYQTQKLNPLSKFLDYAQYRVDARTIIDRKRHVVYQNKSENLVQRQDTRYLGFEWVLVYSWLNSTISENTVERVVEEGLTIREGTETEKNFSVSASFKGIGITAGGSTKYFNESETSSLTRTTKTIAVPPHTAVYLYQKRYNFLAEVWFWQHVPNWKEYNHFIIGADETYARVERCATISILAQEFATTHEALSGSTNITAQWQPPLDGDPYITRQFKNITKMAKNQLKKWGITG